MNAARVIAVVLLFSTVEVGCDSIPSITYYDADAGSIDATLVEVDASLTDAGSDAIDAIDASLPDTYAPDAGTDAESPSDAGPQDSSDALACLPANAPPEAGCCYAVLPCAGLGCDHCSACIAQACHTNQFCCAQLNGQGTYTGVQCSGDGKNCP